MGSVPDHHNRANIAIKWVTQMFWFTSAYKSYAYTLPYSIKCEIALCLKTCTLVKKYFIAKRC